MILPSLDGVEYGVPVECPKCGSKSAWFEATKQDVHLRCFCGVMKLVATTLKDMTIEHIDAGQNVSLPRQGSKLWDCLMVLVALKTASTTEITAQLSVMKSVEQDSSDVASCLTVLRYKGLVVSLNKRRGFTGGSTWEVTTAAKALLGE